MAARISHDGLLIDPEARLSTRSHVLRVCYETIFIGVVALLLLSSGESHLAPGLFETGLFSVYVVVILYYFLRMRLPTGNWPKHVVFEFMSTAIVGLLVIGGLFVYGVSKIPFTLFIMDWETFSERYALSPTTYFVEVADSERPVVIETFRFHLVDSLAQFILTITLSSAIVVRVGKRGWRYWNVLRKRYLIWEMTHTHLVPVVFAVMILLFSLSLYSIIQTLTAIQTDEVAVLVIVIATFIFTYLSGAVLLALSLLAILAPAAWLSYRLSQPVAEQLAAVVELTDEMGAGNYDVRVDVIGTDEVAHLQHNFNSMADTLQNALIQLEAERDKLHSVLAERRELFTSISHELRTPLATIRSYLESIQSRAETLQPMFASDIDIMHRATLHLDHLLNDLLVLTGVDEARLELNPIRSNVGPILRRLATAMAPVVWQQKKIKISTQIPDTLPDVIIDEVRIEQIIHNLIQNATRHTPTGGIIILTAMQCDPEIQIMVRDTGSGIEPSELPLIWERFYRTAQARQDAHQGAGLGLALVKELAEAMGGRVSVESTPGTGSNFMVWLPQARFKIRSEGLVTV